MFLANCIITNGFAQQRFGSKVISYRGEGHQPPPESFHKGPGVWDGRVGYLMKLNIIGRILGVAFKKKNMSW